MYLCVTVFKNKSTVFAFTQKQLVYYLINRHTHTPMSGFSSNDSLKRTEMPPTNTELVAHLYSVKINNSLTYSHLCSWKIIQHSSDSSSILVTLPLPQAHVCSSDMASSSPPCLVYCPDTALMWPCLI